MNSALTGAWAIMPHGRDGSSIPSSGCERHPAVSCLAFSPGIAAHGTALAVAQKRGHEARDVRIRVSDWYGNSQKQTKCRDRVMRPFDLGPSVKGYSL